jgi:hypothetical protein
MGLKKVKEKFNEYLNGSNGNNLNQCKGRKIVGGNHYPGANDDNFTAIGKARKYVSNKGYSIGSMQRDAPIAIAEGDMYISKWWNLGGDVDKIGGVVLPDPEFRDGGATVVIFE